MAFWGVCAGVKNRVASIKVLLAELYFTGGHSFQLMTMYNREKTSTTLAPD